MSWTRIGRETRDLVELVLVPGLAIILPWPLCFRVFRWMSGKKVLYREASERALKEVQRYGPHLTDPHEWLRARRLITLVDHADLYLAWTRTNRWMLRHVRIEGHWPMPGCPFVLCTFHWGAGMWGLRKMAADGLNVHALVAALEGNQFAGRSVLRWYAKARTAQVGKILGRPVVDISGSLKPVVSALRRGEQVLGVIDVPSDQTGASIEVSFMGNRMTVPKGLLRLAVDRKIPIVVHWLGVDLKNGSRLLQIHSLGQYDNVHALATDAFGVLEAAVSETSAAWHFWAEAPRFFATKG